MTTEPIHIEAEEDVPEVIERVRGLDASDVRLVLPGGARIARSRFNLQLLSQYAERLGKRVTIVSPDRAIQEMARESGLAATTSGLPSPTAATPGPFADAGIAPPAAPGVIAPGLSAVAPHHPVVSSPFGSSAPRVKVETDAPRGSTVQEPPLRNLRIVYAAAGAAALVVILLLVFVAPSATVTLVAQAQPFARDVQVTGQPGSGTIAVRTESVQKAVTQSFQATGSKVSGGQAARGQVQYSNGCPAQLQLVAGQILQGAGQSFAQDDNTQPINPGETATATVHAAQNGAAGNVGPGTITTINNAGLWATCLRVTNPGALAGGADEQHATVISQADIQQARTVLEQQARQQIQSDLGGKVHAAEKMSPTITWGTPTFNTDHKADDGVKTFNGTMTLQGEGAYYVADDVSKAMASQLRAQVARGQQLTDAGTNAQYQVTGAPGGHLTFKGRASGYVAPAIDLNQVSKSLPGKSVGSAGTQLHKLPVRDVRISQSPFPLPMLPFLSSRIDVRYEVDVASAPG